DYNARKNQLVLRMPTAVHEMFIDGIEDATRNQLKLIRKGSSRVATFAQRVCPARLTDIYLLVEDTLLAKSESKCSPDASFCHDGVLYLGVIIEVLHSQKRMELGRLADSCFLDSDTSV
ncbi:hypothetical protein BDY21DRAFT_294386, partial [Lineolata rhizophorae]